LIVLKGSDWLTYVQFVLMKENCW